MKMNEGRIKSRLVSLLKKRGYHQDERPDHREWIKFFDEFSIKVRLDQNNPDGFNGFQFQLSAYLRHGVKKYQIKKIFDFLKQWYEAG